MGRGRYVFAKGLQEAVLSLRKANLVEEGKFPRFLGPIEIISEKITCRRGRVPRFIVKVEISENSVPNTLWLKFDRKAQRIYISYDRKEQEWEQKWEWIKYR